MMLMFDISGFGGNSCILMGSSQDGGILMGPNVIIGDSNTFNHLGSATNSSVLGGNCHKIEGNFSSIGGGIRNTASAGCTFIGGGCCNNITSAGLIRIYWRW